MTRVKIVQRRAPQRSRIVESPARPAAAPNAYVQYGRVRLAETARALSPGAMRPVVTMSARASARLSPGEAPFRTVGRGRFFSRHVSSPGTCRRLCRHVSSPSEQKVGRDEGARFGVPLCSSLFQLPPPVPTDRRPIDDFARFAAALALGECAAAGRSEELGSP